MWIVGDHETNQKQFACKPAQGQVGYWHLMRILGIILCALGVILVIVGRVSNSPPLIYLELIGIVVGATGVTILNN